MASGPAETDCPMDGRLATPEQIGAYPGKGLANPVLFFSSSFFMNADQTVVGQSIPLMRVDWSS